MKWNVQPVTTTKMLVTSCEAVRSNKFWNKQIDGWLRTHIFSDFYPGSDSFHLVSICCGFGCEVEIAFFILVTRLCFRRADLAYKSIFVDWFWFWKRKVKFWNLCFFLVLQMTSCLFLKVFVANVICSRIF